MDEYPSPRSATSSRPEDLFVELFAQVFGVENVRLLTPELAVEDIYGVSRFIDFALRTVDERVAFEIDGLTWHVPDAERIAGYEDQLLRQNSLVHQGWRVFRWTDRQIADDPEPVKEQLALFLERVPGLLEFEDFLPRQHGDVIELKPHQEEAPRVPRPIAGRGEHDRDGDPRPGRGQDRDGDRRRPSRRRPDALRGPYARAGAAGVSTVPQALARGIHGAVLRRRQGH